METEGNWGGVKGGSLGAGRGNSVGAGLPVVMGGISGIEGARLIMVTYSLVSVELSAKAHLMTSLLESNSCSHMVFNDCLIQLTVPVIANSIQRHSGCSVPNTKQTSWM